VFSKEIEPILPIEKAVNDEESLDDEIKVPQGKQEESGLIPGKEPTDDFVIDEPEIEEKEETRANEMRKTAQELRTILQDLIDQHDQYDQHDVYNPRFFWAFHSLQQVEHQRHQYHEQQHQLQQGYHIDLL